MGSAAGLKGLYESMPDPSAWYLFDEICAAGADKLLDGVAKAIGEAHKDAKDRQEALNRFGSNILRFAADLQSAKNKLKDTEWLKVLIKDFQRLTEAAGESKKVFELCCDWALKNPLAGGEAHNAQLFMLQIRDGSYVPKHPVTPAGKENAAAEKEERERSYERSRRSKRQNRKMPLSSRPCP